MDKSQHQGAGIGVPIARRQLLQRGILAGASLALVLSGCGAAAAPASSPASGAAARSSGASPAASGAGSSASGAAASGSAVATSWDDMTAAAKREGTVVVAGPPDPDTRTKLPDLIKQRFGVEVQYLSQNSSQVAARMQAERAAGQYNLDLMLAGADTAFTTMLANGWADPLKPALVMPGAADPSKWKTGGPWFRDSNKDTILQLFNTVTTTLTVNAQTVTDTITTAEALLDPKWKGKIASFDPTVNGIGIQVGAALYASKGEDFLRKLYVGQNVILTQDYNQVADWVAKSSYPIGIAVAPQYLGAYEKAGVTFATPELTDAHSQVSGGFGLVILINRAPHPNAARLVANFLANTEGMTMFSQTQQQAPMRTDIDPTWIPSKLIPLSGIDYFDGYDPEFLKNRRPVVLDFFKKTLK